jgi:hypothetical protein
MVLEKKFFKLLTVQLSGSFFLSSSPVYMYSMRMSTMPVPFFTSFTFTSSFMIAWIYFFSE